MKKSRKELMKEIETLRTELEISEEKLRSLVLALAASSANTWGGSPDSKVKRSR